MTEIKQNFTHVKVARCIVDPNDGREMIKQLGSGGEAQLWDLKTWNQYHKYLQENPSHRGTMYYPWTFIEYLNPPADDLKNYVLLPEKTGGREFEKLTNN